jgi:hypothetical protein
MVVMLMEMLAMWGTGGWHSPCGGGGGGGVLL